MINLIYNITGVEIVDNNDFYSLPVSERTNKVDHLHRQVKEMLELQQKLTEEELAKKELAKLYKDTANKISRMVNL